MIQSLKKKEKKARCLGKRIRRNLVEDMKFEIECHDREDFDRLHVKKVF